MLIRRLGDRTSSRPTFSSTLRPEGEFRKSGFSKAAFCGIKLNYMLDKMTYAWQDASHEQSCLVRSALKNPRPTCRRLESPRRDPHHRRQHQHCTAFLVTAGKACSEYQDRHLRGLACKRVQVDEIWAFCYVKARNVATAKAAPEQAGDIWTWTAIDAENKLAVSWLVGSRDAEAAHVFMADVAARLANRVQLTSDGHNTYLMAVWDAFGREVDYAQLVPAVRPSARTGRPLQPGSVCRCRERAASSESRMKPTSARPLWSDRTLQCGCICGVSQG